MSDRTIPLSVVKPMSREKLLLIFDGHCSHTLSLAVIGIPLKDGIVAMSLHSHGMPLTQRLDACDRTILEYARDE
jgi:hypothetical protein